MFTQFMDLIVIDNRIVQFILSLTKAFEETTTHRAKFQQEKDVILTRTTAQIALRFGLEKGVVVLNQLLSTPTTLM
jgi:hypothetical protein